MDRRADVKNVDTRMKDAAAEDKRNKGELIVCGTRTCIFLFNSILNLSQFQKYRDSTLKKFEIRQPPNDPITVERER